MVLIVESGSTKSDWVLLSPENKQDVYSSMGFNPYFHSSAVIENELRRHAELMSHAEKIQQIYFYGAGCSSSEMNDIVKLGLTNVFTNAHIHIDHDLMACAYATYSGNPSICCIIGTGSNSCYFDGETVSEVVPALGYILGDEGSGTYFGKKLLSAFLYHQLPKHVEEDFVKEYAIDKNEIVNKVYRNENANVYIASFMPFIAKHKDELFFQKMIEDGLRHFIEVHVCCYPNYKDVEINFVGSIASVFRNALDRAANSLGARIGRVVQKPVEGLVSYHLDYVLGKE
jgi:N-acetylglucosamine kinase-like BadF-type ATPase